MRVVVRAQELVDECQQTSNPPYAGTSSLDFPDSPEGLRSLRPYL